MPGLVNTIAYGQGLRLTDWFHGWRDGLARIPGRPPAGTTASVTTPHREALIRKAQDAFHHEHLVYRTAVAEPHRRIVAARGREEQLKQNLAWAKAAFAVEARPLTEEEKRRRRLGEEDRPERVIVERRLNQHARKAASARATIDRLMAAIEENATRLGAATDEARQEHEAAATRVRRIHEHTHRRLAVYRTSLIRAHPDGAWVNAALSVRAPEIPGWALPGMHGPEGAVDVPRDVEEDEETPPETTEPDPSARIITLTHAVTYFGSDPELDATGHVTLTAPVAAKRHFALAKVDGGLELRTRGHGHGPYIGGEPMKSALLTPGDHFDFADRRYTVQDNDHLDDSLLTACDLIVVDASAKSGSHPRLANMSFVQRANTVLAVLGPSGAGKSSLFEALLGELELGHGRVFFLGMPLDTHGDQIRAQLGYVPQENKTQLHETLTVRRLLRYAFRLRSPSPRGVGDERIEEVCAELQLDTQIDQVISTLSGGQKRRVSIAIELLTKPRLLMLDEPTSGLDPGMDREVMGILRGYAATGRTVIVITHATEHLPWAHQMLVVVKVGRPVYSGPPRHVRRSLKFKSYANLMAALNSDPDGPAAKYPQSRAAKEARYEARKLEKELAGAAPKPAPESSGDANPIQHPALVFFRQLWTMILRQWALVLTRGVTGNLDDGNIAGRSLVRLRRSFVAAMPLLIAGGSAYLADVVTKRPGLGAHPPSGAGLNALSLLTTLCILSGQALTYSDIVTERRIIERERRAGITAVLVTLSKWLVYAVIAVMQGVLITLVFCVAVAHRAPDRGLLLGPWLDLMAGLSMLTVAAMTLGLLVSTLARDLPQAVAIVTGVSIAQIAFNGATSDLSNNRWLGAIGALMPDRWGMAAAASSSDLRGINPRGPKDALWAHHLAQWLFDLGALSVAILILFALATWRLRQRLKQPKRSLSSRLRQMLSPGPSRTA